MAMREEVVKSVKRIAREGYKSAVFGTECPYFANTDEAQMFVVLRNAALRYDEQTAVKSFTTMH